MFGRKPQQQQCRQPADCLARDVQRAPRSGSFRDPAPDCAVTYRRLRLARAHTRICVFLTGLCIHSSAMPAVAQPWAPYPTDAISASGRVTPQQGVAQVSLAPVIKLALGQRHSCALHKDGQVSCWGKGSDGQLDGDLPSPVPVRVAGISGAVQVAAGQTRSCAQLQDGTVRCWRDARERQAAVIEGVLHAAQITSECARLTDGKVTCWGATRIAHPLPGVTNAVAIATYKDSGCAALKDGGIMCWSAAESPQRIPGLTGVVEPGVGDSFACARHRDATVSCWGENRAGQLGRRTGDSPSVRSPLYRMPNPYRKQHPPARIPGLGSVVALSVGAAHACVRMKNDTLSCWGQRRRPDGEVPRPRSGLTAVHEVAVGGYHACAIQEGGKVSCWGLAENGQLGMGWSAVQAYAARVPGIADAVRVLANFHRTCVVRKSGAVACWGNGDATPRNVAGISGAVQIVGSAGLCVRDKQSRVLCQPRPGEPFTAIAIPPVTTLAGSIGYACALAQEGSVWCWGTNASVVHGVFLRGDYRDERPTLAMQGTAVALCAASYRACLIRASGEVSCVGRLNESDSPGPDVPRPLARSFAATSLACGTLASCAVQTDGQVMCWRNWDAPSGRTASVITPALTPHLVAGLTDAVQISFDDETVCARRRDGHVACWGENLYGQVGDGTVGGVRLFPVGVAGVEGAIDISTSGSHSCAVLPNGGVACWGRALDGEVGTYATHWLETPVEVQGLRGLRQDGS